MNFVLLETCTRCEAVKAASQFPGNSTICFECLDKPPEKHRSGRAPGSLSVAGELDRLMNLEAQHEHSTADCFGVSFDELIAGRESECFHCEAELATIRQFQITGMAA